MSNQNVLKKLKTVFMLILVAVMTLCVAFSGLVACNKKSNESTSSSSTSSSYKYTYPSDDFIKNSSFTQDLLSKADTAYPVVSITGWDKSYHNGAISSYVQSGAVDMTTNAWKELTDDLKEDNDLIDALVKQYKSDIILEGAVKPDAQDSEFKKYIVDNFDKYYVSNELCQDAKDKHVYMFNNYPQNEAYTGTSTGTAQTLKSSSKITLEKGKVTKISVYVKTKNITNQADPIYAGANLRLIPTFNNRNIGEYRLTSIKVTDWTKYTVYVKADANYTTSITLALGLGFGQGSNTLTKYYTQGTALFDCVTCEVIEPEDIQNVTFAQTTNFNYVDDSNYVVNASNEDSNYLFNLSMDFPESFPAGYFKKLDIGSITPDTNNTDALYTKSNVSLATGPITSKNITSDSNISASKSQNNFTATLNKASATIELNSPDFMLNASEYMVISFKLLNNLKAFGSENITIDVLDIDNDVSVKRPAVVKFDENSEDETTCTIVVKNNFENIDGRKFKILIVVGPTILTDIEYGANLATGSVTISDMYITDNANANNDDAFIITDVDSDNYVYYNLFNSTADGIIDLFAGYNSIPDNNNTTSTTYSITESPSDLGTIKNFPANPKDYDGIVSNHVYVNPDGEGIEYQVNTRSGQGQYGNYAGLINSEYISEYKKNLTLPQDTINNFDKVFEDLNEKIQPLMIYNKAENGGNAYGFISEKKTVSASSSAKISVRVKIVDESAFAYIYLVDVSQTEKKVMALPSFVPNVDTNEIYTVGTVNSDTKCELSLKVDKNTKTDLDGWATINFYVGTGKTAKDFRLELWNGSRTGEKSTGMILFNTISINTSGGFNESLKYSAALYEDTSSPLYCINLDESATSSDMLIPYKQELTDTEKKFNNEYPDKVVSYQTNYVWAKTSNMVYAIYRPFDPVENNPYDSIVKEEKSSGCTANNDPSAFWLSFSSILLAACIVIAMIMLIVKNVIRRRKANASDAKSHYNVESRIKKEAKKAKKSDVVEEIQEVESSDKEGVQEEIIEEDSNEQPNETEDDSYTYQDVQSFGEEAENQKNSSDEN